MSNNKKSGVKSEVYPFTIEDARKVSNYMKENEMWNYLLIFTYSCNMARRIGDTLSLRWCDVYNPATGRMRDNLEVVEEKTKKISTPRFNSACKNATQLYIEKTGCDPSFNKYSNPVFMQLYGPYAGRVVTADAYRKTLKKAAAAVGIEYNVGTHSTRKFFGKISKQIHPGDVNSTEMVQKILKHSSASTTLAYIGLTKEGMDKYHDDFGDFYNDYVDGDKVFDERKDNPIVSLDSNDLREVIKTAYELGMENTDKDAMAHVDAINQVLDMVDTMIKR